MCGCFDDYDIQPLSRKDYADFLTEKMPGGIFFYRADEGHELLYANQNMVDIFECSDFEEFSEFVGHSFDGKIFPMDRERYRDFQNFSDLRERVEESKKGFISDVFRLRQLDGSFQWKEIYLMMIPGTGGKEYLFCIKPYMEERSGWFEAGHSEGDEYVKLWDSLVWNSDIKFFWKDRERRFRGASQAFLDFYGIRTMDELIGKTDEDIYETALREIIMR